MSEDKPWILGFNNDVIPPLPREERDRLRALLEEQARSINDAISRGWRVDRVEYTVAIEEGGYSVLLFMEKL